MASSRGTSNGPDWLDLATAIQTFEESNKVVITVGMVLQETRGIPDLIIDAQAWERKSPDMDPVCLASAKTTCLGTNRVSLAAVHFQLLYALDFQLALRELENAYKTADAAPGAE